DGVPPRGPQAAGQHRDQGRGQAGEVRPGGQPLHGGPVGPHLRVAGPNAPEGGRGHAARPLPQPRPALAPPVRAGPLAAAPPPPPAPPAPLAPPAPPPPAPPGPPPAGRGEGPPGFRGGRGILHIPPHPDRPPPGGWHRPPSQPPAATTAPPPRDAG